MSDFESFIYFFKMNEGFEVEPLISFCHFLKISAFEEIFTAQFDAKFCNLIFVCREKGLFLRQSIPTQCCVLNFFCKRTWNSTPIAKEAVYISQFFLQWLLSCLRWNRLRVTSQLDLIGLCFDQLKFKRECFVLFCCATGRQTRKISSTGDSWQRAYKSATSFICGCCMLLRKPT